LSRRGALSFPVPLPATFDPEVSNPPIARTHEAKDPRIATAISRQTIRDIAIPP